jgi:hypothetical protein
MFSFIQLPSSLGLKKILTAIRTITAVDYDIQAVAPVNPNAVVTGAITGNGQTVVAAVTDAGTVAVTVDGTYSLSLAFEACVDITQATWVAVTGKRTDTPVVAPGYITSITSLTLGFEFSVSGFSYFRVRSTAYTSGQANINIGLSPSSIDPSPVVSIAKNISGGATAAKLVSAATTNATSLKATAGQLYSAHATNNSASWRYLKFYNKASAPTVGTDVPVLVFGLPPTSSIPCALPADLGVSFTTGIAYAITGGIADADTAAIGAAEVALALNYA